MFYLKIFFLYVLTVCFGHVVSSSTECSNFTLSGCSCTFLETMIQITCNNTVDISSLANSLDSAFGEYTCEIILEHVSTIPPRVIEGLNVFRFVVNSPETHMVSQNALDGVKSLEWFYVYVSSLTQIPTFTNVTQWLRNVNVDNSLLTEVEDEFQNLPLLTQLSLQNNSLGYIREDAFSGTTKIQSLDLSHNILVSLPPNLFNELTDLENLALSHNRLQTVHGLFQNLGPKLRFLNLEFNNLSDADDILPSKMHSLQSLSLGNNPLNTISVNTFNDTVPHLTLLSLRHCNLTEFRAAYFKSLSSLQILDLSFNQIKLINGDYMIFGVSFDLIMNGNRIERFEGGITHRTRRLFVADNNLHNLGNMIKGTKLKEVDISRNRLISLEKKDFFEVYKLEIISFMDNQIEKIDARCFESAENSLQYLDLSGNRLTNLNSSLQFLAVLKTLNISNNALDKLDYEELKGLNELSSLYLQDNKILALSGKVENLPSLENLILKNNEISQLSLKQIPGTLRFLHIKGNLLKCNCELYNQFLKSLKKGFPELDVIPCTHTNASEILSYYPCPSPCSCYCDSGLTPSAVKANCSSRDLSSVPSELNEGTSSSSATKMLYRINVPDYVIYDKMVWLDLSQNGIRFLDEVYFCQDLEKLYLANNRLTTLPYNLMNLPKLKDVTLSGNKWVCGCDSGKAVEFRNWLLPGDVHVSDINKTMCYNLGQKKIIISVSEAEFCPTKLDLYVIIGLVLLGFFVLFLCLTILYNRYKVRIKQSLYSKGFFRAKQEDSVRDKTVDVFISFSNADRNFVTGEIVPEIKERCPGINIFSEGIYLYEELMKERKLQSPSFLENKITVIIVTRNFLDDQSCLSVMRVHKEEHDEFHPMIVVKVDNLPPEWEEKVKNFVPQATYLEWGDIYFWHKFINLVPQTVEPRTTENDRNFPPLVTSEL